MTMGMGCVPISKGMGSSVVKLVHPGGFVELHMEPVTAAEVMNKNPRHSVTRPDVFKYPWVVVKPESILNPGEVFYIVPNRTIYKLLQAHRSSRRHRAAPSPNYHDHNRSRKEKTPIRSKGTMKPKYRSPSPNRNDHYRSRKAKSPLGSRTNIKPEHRYSVGSRASMKTEHLSPVGSSVNAKKEHRTHNKRFRKQSESSAGETPKHRDRNRLHEESRVGPWDEVTSMSQDSNEHLKQQYSGSSEISRMQDDGQRLETRSSTKNPKLKSCLRKPGEYRRRSSSLRVNFLLPGDDKKKLLKKPRFSENFMCKLSINW